MQLTDYIIHINDLPPAMTNKWRTGSPPYRQNRNWNLVVSLKWGSTPRRTDWSSVVTWIWHCRWEICIPVVIIRPPPPPGQVDYLHYSQSRGAEEYECWGTRNQERVGEGQQKFTWPGQQNFINPEEGNCKFCSNFRKSSIFDAV